MIFSNMEYPGKDYRVLVYDSWLGEDFHSLDNPQDGDKIVYREMGEDGLPKVTKTEVYSNGEWVEEGSGGGDDGGGGATPTVLYDGDVTLTLQYGAYSSGNISVQSMDELPDTIDVVWDGVEYLNIAHDNDYYYYGASYDGEAFDFSEYPFAVTIFELDYPNDTMMIYGEEAGTFSATVSAIISGGGITTESLYVTENGDYYADEGTAYDYVNVAVPTPTVISITLTNNTGETIYGQGFINSSLLAGGDNIANNASKTFYSPDFDTASPIVIFGVGGYDPPAGMTIQGNGQYPGYVTYSSDGGVACLVLNHNDRNNISITLSV